MTATAVVVGCTVLLLGGVIVVVLWGRRRIREPADGTPAMDHGPPFLTRNEQTQARTAAKSRALRRYLWWANLVSFAALLSALLAAWPGGRLAMRVLADTSPDSVQGRLTEAQFVVGLPTLGGSMALLIFGGLPAGYCAALLYVMLRRWLPTGRLAGPSLGVLLLVWVGALVDPLRAGNIDFDIVGPGWLAVALFGGLAILHGAVAAAAAGWWSEQVPQPQTMLLRHYIPLLLGSILLPPAGLAVAAGALAVLLGMSVVPADRLRSTRRRRVPTWLGAGVVVVASAAALPVFLGAVISILSRAG